MKSKTTKTIIFFIFISTVILLFILWLVDFSPVNLPEHVPGVQLRTYGILILATFIIIFILLQRSLLKSNTHLPVWHLIIASAMVGFSSLFIYQLIRQLIILREDYPYTLYSVFLSSAIPTIGIILIAASIALELKKIRGIWQHVPTAILLILFLLTRQYLHQFEW